MTKRIIAGCFALILVVALMMGGLWYDQHLAVKVPTFPSPAKTIWLRQNWTAPQRSWFHHADQGTLTFGMPFEWFIALDPASSACSSA
jgi:hypothetical protein